MRVSVRRIGSTAGAAALALVLAGVGFAGGQHVSAQARGGPGGRFGGPGAPGGPGMGRRGPGGPGGPGELGMVLRGLDLSQNQRDRVKQIMDSHKDEQKAIGDRAIAAHEALEDAMTSGTLDEALVRTRAEAVSAVEVDQTVLQARLFSEVYQILTADQQSKLQTMRAERKSRREQMKASRDKRTGAA